MAKYCKFTNDVLDYTGTSILYSKSIDYLVTQEDSDNYYFGIPVAYGISKLDDTEKNKDGTFKLNTKFNVIEK